MITNDNKKVKTFGCLIDVSIASDRFMSGEKDPRLPKLPKPNRASKLGFKQKNVIEPAESDYEEVDLFTKTQQAQEKLRQQENGDGLEAFFKLMKHFDRIARENN